MLSVQGFSRDLCSLRASALTLYTLLSIVPVIALLFGIAKGFGLEKMMKQELIEKIPSQETMVLQLINFAQNMLESTKGEVVAGTGIIILFWTIIKVIGNIEESFNYIWKLEQGRSISRKFSDYLSLMLLAPIILITSGSITVFLKTQLTWLINAIQLPGIGDWLVIRALSLAPLVLMAGLFSFTFIFMPNHKINYKAGIIAGIVTAIMYALAQSAYLSLQIGVSTYNAIYGSFAALPLFVAWLQIGWMIVLFGCEIAFFLQNYENYRHSSEFSNLSFSLKKVIALQITHLIVKNFIPINNPLTAAQIAKELAVPIAIIQSILLKLMASHIIVEFKTQDEYEVYQPAVDVNRLTIAYVVNALEQCGQNHLPGINQEQLFVDIVNNFRKLIEASEQDRLLKDI
ncbi:MAG: YihY/virulence factor BrkB family protein [Methylobacter sp.]|uniref:YihY/virulence factor BrkB family protein n=1 Tax=Methylobacter sp. TaxID=2051955 RepID=UPI0027303EC5|nr:YihY/virulence factor BrkB family protein [Methylobacter sp.]MDP1667061.1 YihY/virulence factor BrkB family protein [Methylobacter sp.]